MSDYTPTTDTVQATYAAHHSKCAPCGEVAVSLRDEFDRWLSAHDREVAARALREAAVVVGDEWLLAAAGLLNGRADAIEKGGVDV